VVDCLTIVEVNRCSEPYQDGDYAEKWNPQSRYQFVVEAASVTPTQWVIADRGFPYWPQMNRRYFFADDVSARLESLQSNSANFESGKIVMAEEFRRANDLHTVHSFEQSFGEIPVTFEPHTQVQAARSHGDWLDPDRRHCAVREHDFGVGIVLVLENARERMPLMHGATQELGDVHGPGKAAKDEQLHWKDPLRMALAGGWIDQPFVSRLNPDLRVPWWSSDWSRHSASWTARDGDQHAKNCRKLWNGALPEKNPMILVRELYEAENTGKANPSGSQDMAGLILPGIIGLTTTISSPVGCFPPHVESCNDPDVGRWLEDVIHLLPIAPRPDGYSPLDVQHLNAAWCVAWPIREGMFCCNPGERYCKAGASLNECMSCWKRFFLTP